MVEHLAKRWGLSGLVTGEHGRCMSPLVPWVARVGGLL